MKNILAKTRDWTILISMPAIMLLVAILSFALPNNLYKVVQKDLPNIASYRVADWLDSNSDESYNNSNKYEFVDDINATRLYDFVVLKNLHQGLSGAKSFTNKIVNLNLSGSNNVKMIFLLKQVGFDNFAKVDINWIYEDGYIHIDGSNIVLENGSSFELEIFVQGAGLDSRLGLRLNDSIYFPNVELILNEGFDNPLDYLLLKDIQFSFYSLSVRCAYKNANLYDIVSLGDMVFCI
ncbi:MAG: hypothetical protein FWF56_04965 [Firmicutes bacterium]|nr:hypothetical protein [Bacillota bacterium]MCL1954163.1 hypothetical protein [Bacillota bacterium]